MFSELMMKVSKKQIFGNASSKNNNLQPDKWNFEADVVVIGFGAAGASTAITANNLGARVIILEKAPKGQEGGNSRVAAQGYLNPSSVKKGAEYLTALCGPYTVPKSMILAWADEMSKNNEWLKSIGGNPQEHQHPPTGIEFPDLPGSESVHKFHEGPIQGYSNTWKVFEHAVKRLPIKILYETPCEELIQNHISKEILGVKAVKGQNSIFVKACKAVVLTCGGFENNQEMIRNYLPPGMPYCYPSGSPYNEGDGIKMSLAVGADLWHMNNFSGPQMALKVSDYKTTFSLSALHFKTEIPGGMIVVGPNGKRFIDEKFKTLHGKVNVNGSWIQNILPCPMFMIFDRILFSSGPLYDKTPRHGWAQIMEGYNWSEDNSSELEKGWIKKSNTIAELAKSIKLDPIILEKTVNNWNIYCKSRKDLDFGRTKMFTPIKEKPFYAVELSPTLFNTQGGPRRNEKCQILQPDGKTIPRLYSAGELGSIYSYLYQGSGNIGECMATGRISARNAIAEKPWK